MNPHAKRLWLAALHGPYRHAHGRGELAQLVDGTWRYCALGVLCNIHAREFNRTWDPYCPEAPDYHYCPEAFDWAGLYKDEFDPESTIDKLSDLNDSSNSFTPVIAYIRKNL